MGSLFKFGEAVPGIFEFYCTKKWGFFRQDLKLLSTIFYKIFIFHQIIALQKLWKMFFISSKKLFSFLRYLNFYIFVFPLFFSLSAIALEVDPRKILKLMMSSTV